MSYGSHDFVNRDEELRLFENLLADRRHRILLLHGEKGIGKSSVAQRMRRACGDRPIISMLVDFRSDRTLSDAEQLIAGMRERIGGSFAERMAQFELQMVRDFPISVPLDSLWNTGAARETVASGAGGGMSLSGQIFIGGDAVARDKIEINNSSIIVYPRGGPDLARAEIERRRNIAFRTALADLLANQRAVLFFDHFEETTEDVVRWLNQHLFQLYLDDSDMFHNLWIVVAGLRIPLQEELDPSRQLSQVHLIGPLSDDAVALFWVHKRGLSEAVLQLIIRLSKGSPQLLCLMANNYEMDLGMDRVGV